jgi:glycosyltransferase 2 family protein
VIAAATVKPFSIAALVVGLAATVAIVVIFGAHEIGAAFERLGATGFLTFCAARAPVVAVLGTAWRLCFPTRSQIRLPGAVASRILRDAGSEVLPLSEVGGFVIGARAATLAGATASEAAGSTLIDLTTEAVAQLGFVAIGLAALYGLRPDAALIRPASVALIVLVIAILGAVALAKSGAGLIGAARAAVSERLAIFGDVDAVFRTMGAIARRRGRLVGATAIHLVGWLSVAAEGWLALRLIGTPIPYAGAIALESLLFAARSFGFFAPNGLGVQEGAYALLAPLVGLDIGDALALSLVKRARDIVIGAPALLLWQRIEASRIWRRR